MNVLALLLTLGLACLLLAAAMQKVLDLGSFRLVLEQLGFSTSAARWVAPLVLLLEVSASLGLVFQPGAIITLTLVVALGLSFAFAGSIALINKRSIQCRCFGRLGNGILGAPQILSLPVWLGVAVLLWFQPPPAITLADQAAAFATVCLILALLGAWRSLRSWRVARDDRQSAQETYVWLQS